jgi:hypothetical protein
MAEKWKNGRNNLIQVLTVLLILHSSGTSTDLQASTLQTYISSGKGILQKLNHIFPNTSTAIKPLGPPF